MRDRDVPGCDPVRLEHHDVGIRLPPRQLARDDRVQLLDLQPVELSAAATGSIRSPDSSRASFGESQQTRVARAITWESSSRARGSFRPSTASERALDEPLTSAARNHSVVVAVTTT